MPQQQGATTPRPPGQYELFNIARNALRFYNCVGSTARYAVSSRFLAKAGGMQAVTFAVLSDILKRHPALSLSIAGESTQSPSWVRLSKIDLREVVQFEDLNESYQFVEDMHQTHFDQMGELPLWRVIVVGRPRQDLPSWVDAKKDRAETEEDVFEVGFFYHHAIGDGKSGPAFHMDFLDTINVLAGTDPAENVLTNAVVRTSNHDLLPSLEEAYSWPLSMKFVASQIFKEYLLPGNQSLWTGPLVQFSPNHLPKTRLLTLFFDSPTRVRLTELCRQNGVTMTPLLTVVVARLLASRYATSACFGGSVAISLRRFTGVDDRQVVNHVASVTVPFCAHPKSGYVSITSGHFGWSAVRSCKKVIDAVATSPANHDTALLRFVKDYRGWFQKRIGKRREASFEVSNIGIVDGGMERGAAARFHRILFSQPANVTGAPYCFSIATAKGGDMAIMLTWQDGTLQETEAGEVLAALEAEIQVGRYRIKQPATQ